MMRMRQTASRLQLILACSINTIRGGYRRRGAAIMLPTMSWAYLLSIAIQVALVVHCIKTGRNTIWIWALMLLPLAGPIAYVIVEILPELGGSRTSRRAVRSVSRALDPHKDLRNFETRARLTGDVASRQSYAAELVRQGRSTEAIDAYRQTLKGLYEHDPNLLLGLAQAQFAADKPAEARATLDSLIASNPDFKSPDGHLLYARALQAEGNATKALEEYKVVAGYYAGAEAALRYAQLLRTQGQRDEARRVLTELIDHARLAPPHYRKAQAEWLGSAERELSNL
jgi:hypothetical protein